MSEAPKKKKKAKSAKPLHQRSCAACGLWETDNIVDGKRVPFRLDSEKRLICATCPVEVLDD